MSILSDIWIREQAHATGMIEPFVEAQRRDGCISYGLSSYGYDARVADEFKIFTNVDSSIVDPKEFDPKNVNQSSFDEYSAKSVTAKLAASLDSLFL